MPDPTKVVVALSGGVDSSVAAALLKEQGHEVIGIMLRLWSESGKDDDNRCCTPDAMATARRVAARLSIPFYVIDAKELFYSKVVQQFINGYAQNLTPNPCLTCNQHVRWGFLLSHTLSLGAQFLATGHYARLRQDENGIIQLLQAIDRTKDQSYVLHVLTQDQLQHTVFPVGGLNKSDVRDLAHKFNLPTAERPDSQDLCFLGSNDYRDFLARYSPGICRPGPILTTTGAFLGMHLGLAFYTIGQRKGLGIASTRPFYVIRKDNAHNTLIIGHAEELGRRDLDASQVNWISGTSPSQAFRAQVKIRYKAIPEWAEIQPLGDFNFRVQFDNILRDITPGQAAVIYQDDICLGGGIIS